MLLDLSLPEKPRRWRRGRHINAARTGNQNRKNDGNRLANLPAGHMIGSVGMVMPDHWQSLLRRDSISPWSGMESAQSSADICVGQVALPETVQFLNLSSKEVGGEWDAVATLTLSRPQLSSASPLPSKRLLRKSSFNTAPE